MDGKKKFSKILDDIKNVRIQGARTIARKALEAYFLVPSKKSLKLLVSARPTEPMLEKALNEAKNRNYGEITGHFDSAQEKINSYVLKIIKNRDVIFTHCHSTNVVQALVYAKKHGKKFEVYNTETRPIFQGRKTSLELAKAGIKVTQFVDSAALVAMTKSQGTKKADKVFFGADALLKDGIINKIGSGMFAELANDNGIPVYIVADSWKFTSKKIPLEKRKLNEIWDKAPKNIKIKNPAFEFVPKKHIHQIVSEIGAMPYEKFVRKISKIND